MQIPILFRCFKFNLNINQVHDPIHPYCKQQPADRRDVDPANYSKNEETDN